MGTSALNIVEKDRLPVFIDGNEFLITARDLSRSHTVAQFIHDHVGRSARQACGEGGCGACAVIVTSPTTDPDNPEGIVLRRFPVAACITPIGDLAFASVSTPQGRADGPHAGFTPAQEALVATNGAQCGFCTGGIVSVLDSTCSGQGCSTADVEALLDGNLCRCTGYRAISEAAQMLCDDYDGENATLAREIRAQARGYRARAEDPSTFPQALYDAYRDFFRTPGVDGVALVERSRNVGTVDGADRPGLGGGVLYSHVRPSSVSALARIYGGAPNSIAVQAAGGADRWERRRLLSAGYTDAAYDEEEASRHYHHTVSVRDVPELRRLKLRADGSLEIGAATTISALRGIADTLVADLADRPRAVERHRVALDALTTQTRYFANETVRHSATIGGGLVSCHFLSDMVPVWLALDVRVDLFSRRGGARTCKVRDLVDVAAGRLRLAEDEIVVALVLPPRDPGAFVAEAFKQAIRRTDSMALVSAGMSAERDGQGRLQNVCLAFGGLGAPGLRASRAEAALEGGMPTGDATRVEAVLDALQAEVAELNVRALPPDMRTYQSRVAAGFLRRFLLMAAPEGEREDAPGRLRQPPCRGRQVYAEEQISDAIVGRAMVHRYVPHHARGDTRYTVDALLPEDGLHAAIVPAPVASGTLTGIDDSLCRNDRDFVGLVTAQDVPGSNVQGHMVHPLAEEEIICSGRITHHGQPVALALARTQAAARTAAARVRVMADADDAPPILTFDDIVSRQSWFSFEHDAQDPSREARERRLTRGDPVAAFQIAAAAPDSYAILDGEVEVGGQSCFYLEPQCAVAYPQSQGGVRIVSSTQSPAHVARYVASALGVAEHRINIEAGFIGGGFGGKQTRSASFAAMAALAARHVDRPVKLELPRATDMALVPGRSPYRAQYRIALERQTGAIAALEVDMMMNGGAGEDYSPSIAETSVFLIDNAYFLENAAIRARCGRSNLPAGFTATRGYGKPQTGAIIETILDEAAARIGLDPQDLRARNLYRRGQSALAGTPIDDDVLRACWEGAVGRRYADWRQERTAFNRTHRHLKRGVAGVPSKGNMGFLEAADINRGAAVVRIHSDGSIRVSHSGVEMGQGLNTKMCQVTAQALKVPMERVAIDTTRTADLPNTPPTTMVATDMIGAAILKACDSLLETLARHGYPANADFTATVQRCYEDGLPLQAWGEMQEPRLRFDWEQQQGDVSYFFVWGAALSEVEVDAGTGSWRILRAHITQDCGKSLNPVLDVGQVEGGFAFGLGYALLEKMIYRPDGSLLSDNVSSYKIPSIDDMPRDWTVEILQETAGPPGRRGLHNSKGVGEANIQLGFSAYFAVKDAIREIRRDRGLDPNGFSLPFPAMTHDILRACADG